MTDLQKQLLSLLNDKFGYLKKLEIHTGSSEVPVGTTRGMITVHLHEDFVWLNCVGINDWVKTSPIQEIVNIESEYNVDKIAVTFKTKTSTYIAIVDNERLTEDNDNYSILKGESNENK